MSVSEDAPLAPDRDQASLDTRPKASGSAERVRRHRLKKKLSAEAGPILFTRQDWSLFLDPARLPQKAGSDAGQVRAVALKELADNALDAGASATLERVDADTWIVADDGPGLDAAAIATLFAVSRPRPGSGGAAASSW
jgi:hypothetical protein